MKLPSILVLGAAGACLLLTSCETTGDPTQGGLFGWSQSKANQRISDREQRLYELERSNAYQHGRSDALEGQLSRKQKGSQSSW